MYRHFFQGRRRFWIWWMIFSAIHFAFSAIVLCCYGIWDLDLTLWLSERANEFIEAVAAYFYFCLNVPVWFAAVSDLVSASKMLAMMLMFAMTVLDSILYGLGLAGLLWLAERDAQTWPRYLGFTPRVVGRGLFFAMAYYAVSTVLAIVLQADSDGLLTSYFVWRDEIVGLLNIMHPLLAWIGLDVQIEIQIADNGIQYTLIMMLDSALIGVLFMWVWTWFLSDWLAGRRNRRAV